MNPPLLADDLIERAARRLKVLGDPVRMQILNALRIHGELIVQEIVDVTEQRQANVSKHLGILSREHLVSRRREGVNVYYRLSDPSVQGICLLVSNSLRAQEEDAEETA